MRCVISAEGGRFTNDVVSKLVGPGVMGRVISTNETVETLGTVATLQSDATLGSAACCGYSYGE